MQFHGNGTFVNKNGLKIEGKWVHGQLEGNMKVSDQDPSTHYTWTAKDAGTQDVAQEYYREIERVKCGRVFDESYLLQLSLCQLPT